MSRKQNQSADFSALKQALFRFFYDRYVTKGIGGSGKIYFNLRQVVDYFISLKQLDPERYGPSLKGAFGYHLRDLLNCGKIQRYTHYSYYIDFTQVSVADFAGLLHDQESRNKSGDTPKIPIDTPS